MTRPAGSPLRPAIFLDRDGTLNREVDYLRRVEDLELLPGVVAALESLQRAGYALVVVTNQSGVARGLLTEETLGRIHARLAEQLASSGVELLDILWCPHHPDLPKGAPHGACSCRKPAPGMLLDAASRHGLDLASSWTVGDGERDAAAGLAAGTRAALVATGKTQAGVSPSIQGTRVPVLADLEAFAAHVLASSRPEESGQEA